MVVFRRGCFNLSPLLGGGEVMRCVKECVQFLGVVDKLRGMASAG